MKKRFLSVLICLCMALALLSVTAGAAGSNVSIGGVNMYVDNTNVTYYKNGDTTVFTDPVDDWNAKYDPSTSTLTIKNLLVAGTDSKGIESYAPLHLVLEGANSVTGGNASNNSYGIYAYDDLTISGDGALSVTGGDSTTGSSYGIYGGETLTINGGTISATAGSASTQSYGVYSNGALAITGGTVVATGGTASATSGSTFSCGISSNDTITITGGVVVARAGSAKTVSKAVFAVSLKMTDGEGATKAKTAGGDVNSAAVVIVPSDWVDGSAEETKLDFSSGTVTLDKNYYIVNSNTKALYVTGNTTINTNGNTLLAVSLYNDSSAETTYGISAGTLTVNGSGSVIAVSGAGEHNYGIIASSLTTVSNTATVTAIGTTAAAGYSRGIYGAVTADDSARVTAIGGRSAGANTSSGIYGFVTVNDKADVTAIAGKAAGSSYGIDRGVSVNGGTLNAIGGAATASYGIYAYDKTVTIAPGATVNAAGKVCGLLAGTGELAAGSFTGSTNGLKVTSTTAADLLALGYGYYIDGELQQPIGNTVGRAYESVTVKKLPAYTVSFDAGEGTLDDNVTPITVTIGEAYGALPTATPTAEGVTFGGWWTKDGTNGDWGVQVTRDTIVTAVSDHTLYARYGHVHPICGKVCDCTHATHDSVLWEEWNTSNAMPNEAGYYYLIGDVTYTGTWTAYDTVLDLNGNKLTLTEGVTVNSSFTLADCKGGGVLTGTKGGVVVHEGLTFNLYGGTVSTASEYGAVGLEGDATFNQYGGTVKNESANGRGVYGWNSGVYNYYGGTVDAVNYGVYNVATVNLYATPDLNGGKADFANVGKIVFHTELTKPGAAYTVSGTAGVPFTEGWAEYMGDADYTKYFAAADADYIVEKVGGELQLAVLEITDQPTAGNGYTVTVNDPNATYQWYEWGSKNFTVDDSTESEIWVQRVNGVNYDSETQKWKLANASGSLSFFYLTKDDIVTVTFDGEATGTVTGTNINFGAKAGNTWTGTATANGNIVITFSGFTGGETFTITVTRDVPHTLLDGRTGKSLLDKVGETVDSISGGKEYVCMVNDYLTSNPVEYVHVHGSWTYSYEDGVLTATCNEEGCPLTEHKVSTAVYISTSVKYSKNYTCPVTVSAASEWTNAGLMASVTDNGLTDGLNGTATITVGDVEACTVPYTLLKGTLTANNFGISYPADLVYDGSAKAAWVAVHPTNVGAITIKYYKGDVLLDSAPVNVGTYTVELSVADSAYYNELEAVAVNEFTVTQMDIAYVSVSDIPDQNFTGEAITLDESDITITYNSMTLVMGVDFELSGYTNNVYEGEARVTIKGIGNYEGTRTAVFDIVYNTTAVDAFESHSGWFNFNARPTFRLKDGWSWSTDPAVYDWSVEDFAPTNPDDGENQTVKVYVKNADGVYKVTLTYNYDKTWPDEVTAEEVDNTVWSNVSKDIRVTATDALSGIASVEISDELDVPQVVELVDGAYYCTVTESGWYTVTVTDKAGNVRVQVVNVTHIDKYGPSLIISGCNFDGDWHTTAPTVKVEGDDYNGSGIPAEGAYSFDGGTNWQDAGTKEYGDGEHYVAIQVKDNVGNITEHRNPFTLRVDTTAPGNVTVTATVGGESYSGEWTTGDVEFTITGGADATSGIQKYQYKIGDGSWLDMDGDTFIHTTGTDENGVVYQFRAVDNAGNVGEASESITIKKRQPYTIAFNANGGTGEMAALTAYSDTALGLTANAFTYSGHNFVSWNTEADGTGTPYNDKASVENLSAENGATVILYAQWSKEPVFDVFGEVHLHDGAEPGHKVHVTIQKGSKIFAETETNEDGHYDLHGVPSGIYNIVAIDNVDGERTTTAKVEVAQSTAHDGKVTVQELKLPQHDVSSELNVPAGTPDIVVGGLDAEASAQDDGTENTHVTLSMTVEQKEDVTDSAAPEHEESKEQQEAIKETAGSQKNNLTFLEINLERNVEGDGGTGGMGNAGGSGMSVTETETLLELHVPFTTEGRESFKVYRYHDADLADDVPGTVDILTTTSNADGEKIVVGKGEIVICAKKFSTYGIGYTKTVYIPTYKITVEKVGDGGTVKASRIYASSGTTVTLTVTVEDGCEMDSLTVVDSRGGEIKLTDKGDGKYTFRMPSRKVTVTAQFHRCPSAGLSDVNRGEWYHEAIDYVLEAGLMDPASENSFDREIPATRATLVAAIWRSEGSPMVDHLMTYTDLDTGHEQAEAIRWATSVGIVNGFPDGSFHADEAITREQMAVIFYRYEQFKGEGFEGDWEYKLEYADADQVGDWAYEAVCWNTLNGIVQGDGTNFDPKGTATRDHVAQLLMNYLERT